jgi:apolipoprotein N-acyltransferase
VEPVFTRASFVAEVPRLRGRSVYAALGDWVSPLAAGVLLALAFERRRAFRGRA